MGTYVARKRGIPERLSKKYGATRVKKTCHWKGRCEVRSTEKMLRGFAIKISIPQIR
jgi:hypothetical protein